MWGYFIDALLVGVIVFQQVIIWADRKDTCNRLMSKDINDYRSISSRAKPRKIINTVRTQKDEE